MEIKGQKNICTVIVTVDGEKPDIESVIDHASEGLEMFNRFDGFVAGATHVADDHRRIVQYLQWTNKESHEACMAGASWSNLESSKHFVELMEAGKITVNVNTYEVVHCCPA